MNDWIPIALSLPILGGMIYLFWAAGKLPPVLCQKCGHDMSVYPTFPCPDCLARKYRKSSTDHCAERLCVSAVLEAAPPGEKSDLEVIRLGK